MSVLISMLIGSKVSKKALVEKSILSIISSMDLEDFLLVVGVAPYIKSDITNFVDSIQEQEVRLIIIKDCCFSAPEFHNFVFREYGAEAKWFIVAHDDIEVKTKNLIYTLEGALKFSSEDVGWVSFTDDDYLQGHWAPSTRAGFHFDFLYEEAWQKKKMWQFHLLETDYWKKGTGSSYFSNLNYDFPTSAVKCHAPFCHFIAIESEKLRTIGLWETWGITSLLADEDQGLKALKEGLVNVWVPDIIYTHIRQVGGTRSWPIIMREKDYVHEAFAKKWGFYFSSPKDSLKKIKRMYGNTNIPWSMDKRSFEWDYLV